MLSSLACARRLCSVETVRAATPAPPAPPVATPPRPAARGLAVFPPAISACMPAMSASLNARTCRRPISGSTCVSILLRSMAKVDGLIGRLRRPRMRPASASARYQSQTSATVIISRRPASSAGSSPSAMTPSLIFALSRACSTVRNPEPTEDYAAAAIFGISILKNEHLQARRDRADAEASQLAIP